MRLVREVHAHPARRQRSWWRTHTNTHTHTHTFIHTHTHTHLSLVREVRESSQTAGKLVEDTKFCVTAIVSSRFSTVCVTVCQCVRGGGVCGCVCVCARARARARCVCV